TDHAFALGGLVERRPAPEALRHLTFRLAGRHRGGRREGGANGTSALLRKGAVQRRWWPQREVPVSLSWPPSSRVMWRRPGTGPEPVFESRPRFRYAKHQLALARQPDADASE